MMVHAGQAAEALVWMTIGAMVAFVALGVAIEWVENKRNEGK